MARDGVFFEFAMRIHPRFRSPSGALVFLGSLGALLALTGTFQELYSLFVFGEWIFFGSAQESVETMIFGRFLHFVIYDSAAAVAVGMWEAAFCAASQAWRAGRKMPSQNSLSRPPSVISTANSRISGIFGGFSPFRPAFGAKCVILKTRLI